MPSDKNDKAVLKTPMQETAVIDFAVTSQDSSYPLFITGNLDELGNWQPGVLPLECHDGVWRKQLRVPKNAMMEFKVTAGNWQTEAHLTNYPEKHNVRLLANGDKQVNLEVDHWFHNRETRVDTIKGKADYLGHFNGEGIREREIVVWLPTDYHANPSLKFPVLYMHDGQNIIDPTTAYLGVDWQMDKAVEKLSAEGKITPPIIVGIYNTPDRLEEYSNTEKGRAYLDFIVNVIKPEIDRRYRTLSDSKNTAVMGSSMGGLISFLAAWYHPETFGHAACLSPLFWGKRIVTVNAWEMVENAPEHNLRARLYIDNGTVDLERRLMPGCKHMLRVLRNRGYKDGSDLEWFCDNGALHNEQAWAERAWRPLEFMFGNKT